MKKKLFAVLFMTLAVVVLACGFAACSSSEDRGDPDDLDYMRVGDDYVVTGIGTYKGSDLIIPSKYNGLPVTAVDDAAFYMCRTIKSVTVESGVTSIGSYAFYYCKYLESADIPDSVTAIGSYAFRNCTSLENVRIPNAVSKISSYTFYGCTSLRSVTIPEGVTSIGSSAFYNCTSLTEINFNAVSVDDLSSNNYVLYNAGKNGDGITVTVGAGVTVIPAYLFCPYSSSSAYSPKITSFVFENGCVCDSIGNYAFYKCTALLNISMPDAVTSIGDYAFYGCVSLTSIVVPESVAAIGTWAFYGCIKIIEVYNLSSLPIVAGSSKCGYVAEYARAVYTDLSIESKLYTTGGGYMFYDDGVSPCVAGYAGSETALALPEMGFPYEIYQYAFYGESTIMSVIIPDCVTSIGKEAFYGCTSLVNISVPSSVTSIGSSAFYNCSFLTSIDIPYGVSSIQSYTFYNCTSLTDVVIPDSVTSIGSYAFANDASLSEVIVPDGVTEIESSVFSGCSSLESLTIPFVGRYADATSASSSTLFGFIFGTSSYTGSTSTKQYYSGSSSVTYYLPSSLKSVTVSRNSLLYGAFYGCSYLTSVKLCEGVTAIGSHAFYDCYSLTFISLAEGVTSIGDYAFSYCSKLTSIVIPDGVVTIGDYAFRSCSSLIFVTFPDSVVSIGNYAFYSVVSFSAVFYCGNADEWGEITVGTYNEGISSDTLYYYSETAPSEDGNFWHYVDGEPMAWSKED